MKSKAAILFEVGNGSIFEKLTWQNLGRVKYWCEWQSAAFVTVIFM